MIYGLLSDRPKSNNRARLLDRNYETNNEKKKTRKSREEVKEELLRSVVEVDGYENKELHEKVEKVTRYEDAVTIVREYETIIKTQKQNILCLANRQGYIFKSFKEPEKFVSMVKEPGISKSIFIFKINM